MKTPPCRQVWLAGIFWLCSLLAASATQVLMTGSVGAIYQTSTASALPGTALIELGSFTAGFTPTAANTSLWAANWKAAVRMRHNPTTGYFGLSHIYETYSPPVTLNGQAYLWVFTPETTGGQWALLKNTAWKWPAAIGGVGSFPYYWSPTDEGTTAVLGQVNTATYDLRTAPVAAAPLPALPFADWQLFHFPDGQTNAAANRTPGADPDHDAITNLMEYATGTDPTAANAPQGGLTPYLHTSGASTYYAARLDKSPRAVLTLTPQISSALAGWSSLPADITAISSAPDAILVRDTVPVQGNNQRKFIRFIIGLP